MRANILEIIHKIAIWVFGMSPQLAMLQREIDENKILAARVLINQIKSLGLGVRTIRVIEDMQCISVR